MSKLKLTTLATQDDSASVPADTIVNGTAKAWVNFNGQGAVAIRRAFNVSSITDNGNGDYTVNFTNSMVDVNYSAIADTNGNGHINTSWVAHSMFSSAHSTTVTPTTSNFRFCTFHPVNLVNQDTTYNLVTIFS